MSDVASPFSVEYEYLKEGKNEISTITWTFPNFYKLLNNTTANEFRTPVVADKPASKYQLRMLLFGKYNNWIEMYYLSPTSVDLITEATLCEFPVNGSNRPMKSKERTDYLIIQGNKWQYLFNFQKIDMKFTVTSLICQLKLRVLPSDALEELEVRMNERTTTLQHLEDLLTDDKYSDVSLKSVDGEEYRAHKAILASRSEVLRAHFEHNTTEAVTNVIETAFDSEVLRDVLAYIYTSKALHIDDIPEKLLAAADYYQLSGLKRLCEKAVHQRLTVANAIDTLQLAELHSANFLKQSTLQFIKPQVHLILKTEALANVQSVELLKTILGSIALSN